jgi:hypothetical protein
VVEQRALVGDVPVQGRRADPELAREATQGQALEADLGQEIHRGVDDVVAGEGHGNLLSLPSLTVSG